MRVIIQSIQNSATLPIFISSRTPCRAAGAPAAGVGVADWGWGSGDVVLAGEGHADGACIKEKRSEHVLPAMPNHQNHNQPKSRNFFLGRSGMSYDSVK